MNALILGQTDINKASVVDNECMLKPTKSSHRDEYIYIYIYIYSNVTLYIVNIKKTFESVWRDGKLLRVCLYIYHVTVSKFLAN